MDADVDRFESLFRTHAKSVYRFCLRRTHDPVLAEDLTSGVFVEAWRRRDDIDLSTRNPLPWLYGVAANLVRNHQRATRRYEAALRRVPVVAADAEVLDDVHDRVDASTVARAVLVLVEQLPSTEREVVSACLANNMSYAAAAAQLGLPVGTVGSRISRARARLRDLMRRRCSLESSREHRGGDQGAPQEGLRDQGGERYRTRSIPTRSNKPAAPQIAVPCRETNGQPRE